MKAPPGTGGQREERKQEQVSKTATQGSVMLEAAASTIIGPRRGISLLLLPLLIVFVVLFSVRAMSSIERTLAEDARQSVRVVVYELDPGKELRIPIEARTEVLRIVTHLVRRGPLSPRPHEVRLSVKIEGESAKKTEDLVLSVPPGTERAAADDAELSVGDPSGVDVDLRGAGLGQITLSLGPMDEADGLLVRLYRREAVADIDALKRRANMEPEKRERLARRAGQIAWADLPEAEQEALIGARWRKVAALGGSELVERTISIAPAAHQAVTRDTWPLARLDLRTGEKLGVIARGPVTLTAALEDGNDAKLTAILRDDKGGARTVTGAHVVTIEIPEDQKIGVELETAANGVLSVRASDPARVEASRFGRFFRATKERPAIVSSGASPLVLRVTARRPVARSSAGAVSIALTAALAGSGRGAPKPATLKLTASAERSVFDRYDGLGGEELPSSRAVFHVLVPANGKATLAPSEGALDLSLAELDPLSVRPVETHVPPPPGPTPPPPSPSLPRPNAPDWEGFVTRLPSNADAFFPDGSGLVRISPRFELPFAAPSKHVDFRFRKPRSADTMHRGSLLFVPSDTPIEFDLRRETEPILVPVALYSQEEAGVIARIDGEAPQRRSQGVAARITTARQITVKDEVRAAVVLGDDLTRGKHVLTFEAPPGKKAWVHVPWARSAVALPHWISGGFEEP